MAVNELTVSGKWVTNGNWSLAHKPEAKEDAKVPAAKEVKVEAAAVCRSLHTEPTSKFAGNFEIVVGNSEKPEPAVGAGWALKIETEPANFTYTGQTKLSSTYTGEAQKVAITPTLKAKLVLKEGTTAKYKLEAALTVLGSVTIGVRVEAGELQANGQTITASAIETSGTGVIDRTGLVYVTNGTTIAEGWNCRTGAGALVGTVNDTYEITVLTGQFGGGGQEYNLVKLIGRECKVDSANGQTIKTLEVLNKGTAEKGIVFKEAATTTFSTALTFNGTAEERCRVESSVAAKAWKLKHAGDYEPANSFVAVKDCTFEGGVLYLPNGKDEGGNTNVKFEAKPGEGGVVGKATGAILLAGTSKGSVAGALKGKATGTLTLTGTANGTVLAVVAGKATGTVVLTGTGKGLAVQVVAAKATGALTLTGTGTAILRARVTGKAVGALVLTGSASGHPVQVVVGRATGSLVLAGTAKASIASNVVGHATGALLLTGIGRSSATVLPALVRFTNWKAASVRTTNGKAASVRVTNRKAGRVTTINL